MYLYTESLIECQNWSDTLNSIYDVLLPCPAADYDHDNIQKFYQSERVYTKLDWFSNL